MKTLVDSAKTNGSPSSYTVDDNDTFFSGDKSSVSSYSNDGNPNSISVPGTGTEVARVRSRCHG